ncbi:MAG: type II secretion system F family protein [Herminiimonas sp.]|uniref:type II secretion system F family protein n=1 Tax=Herminiimonas sp. TaxID=1926289 RepID=UPI0027292328|nr:type II secretion system F family protein [Herminiimonas sp.]MDO9421458.1 type II secretion system F family protein [Herminiimonas sp.]
MAMYSYQSMDQNGKTVRGMMDAANMPDLEMRLKRMELDLIDCKPAEQRTFTLGRRKITRKDLINFCFHMEQLTGAGVPILEGLADLRDSLEQPRFREVVADMIENIEGGSQLSEAMLRHPLVFDKTMSSLIMAGEQTGRISEVFKNLSESLKWQDELASQTKKIVMYPAFVGTIVLGVTFFLMIFLVPQLTGFIKNMGQELPFHTKALIFVSNIFVNYWYVVLSLPVVIFVIIQVTLKSSERARYLADEYKLRVWMVGPVIHKIILARFVTFFALMYASGITILDCIRLSEEIVNNRMIARALQQAGQLIAEGQGVTAAFQMTGMFPPLIIRMLKVGEATGSLDTALRNVGYFYNRDVKEMIERVQALIEPIMTVLLGALLGWVMLSVLGPIYDTISKIKM